MDKITLAENETNNLSCICGNNEFITFGNSLLGISSIMCRLCNLETTISKVRSNYPTEKLLSAYGEDFCTVNGNVYNGKAVVKELIYTEFGSVVRI